MSEKERRKSGLRECLRILDGDNTILVDSKPPEQFTFDWVAGPEIEQEGIFEKVGKPIAEAALSGYNGSIFAYGQTGSGKTHTIQGGLDNGRLVYEERGLMPRIFDYIFGQFSNRKRTGAVTEYSCMCSFLEIYNEQITDLLNPEATRLQLREDHKKGVYVENLTEVEVDNAETVLKYLSIGSQHRHVCSTAMNEQSSRSHSVFTLYITSTTASTTKHSRLHMIDLAGSERQKGTQSSGTQLREASHINNTLTSLGKVIRRLVSLEKSANDPSSTAKPYVSYRESKLTFLLRDALGGNSMTSIIATVCPSSQYFGETLSTLKFAQRAKLIKNKAIINEDLPNQSVWELQQVIKKMETELAAYKMAKVDGFGGEIQGGPDKFGRDELLTQSFKQVEELQKSKMSLASKIEKLQLLVDQQDNFIQAKGMIIRLLQDKLRRAQKQENETPDSIVSELKQQISILNYCVERHPELTKLQIHNYELREVVEKYQSVVDEEMKIHDEELFYLRRFNSNLIQLVQSLFQQKSSLVKKVLPSNKASDIQYDIDDMILTDDKNEQLVFDLERLNFELLDEKNRNKKLMREMEIGKKQFAKLRKELELKENALAQHSSVPHTPHAKPGDTKILETKIGELESEKKNLENMVNELRQAENQLKIENNELKTELEEKSQCVGDVLNLENQLLSTKFKHEQLLDEFNASKEENELLQRERDFRTNLANQHEKTIQDLTNQLNDYASRTKNLQHELSKCQKDLELSRALVAKTGDEQKKIANEMAIEISKNKESWEKENRKVKDLTEEVKKMELEMDSLKSQLTRESKETENYKDVWTETRNELDLKNQQLQEAFNKIKDQTEEIEELKSTMERDIARISEEKEKLILNSNIQLKEFQEKSDKLLEAQKKDYEGLIFTKLQEKEKMVEFMKQERRSIEEEMKRINNENYKLKELLQIDKNQTGKNLEISVQEAVLKLKKMDTERLQKETDQVKNENAALRRAFEELRNKYDTLKVSNAQNSALIKSQEESILKLDLENKQLSGVMNSRQKIQLHQQIKKENTTLRTEKEQLLKEIAKKDQALKRLSISPAGKPDTTLLSKIQQFSSIIKPRETKTADINGCIEIIETYLKQTLSENKENKDKNF
uniref:Kinesin motor domain-containing protein n=1 Tax=Arcella intermedia TaxID=1963864 RepID=A0A6B2KWP8_9EUKA